MVFPGLALQFPAGAPQRLPQLPGERPVHAPSASLPLMAPGADAWRSWSAAAPSSSPSGKGGPLPAAGVPHLARSAAVASRSLCGESAMTGGVLY